MATTTNYGWTTPDDTALVKDGAAAIRTLGSSVDTTTKALNPSTTLGDIEYRSSTANTNTRLGIGSTGNVLTVVGGVPAWAAPAAGGGKVLQVVQSVYSTATTSTTNSYIDTGLTATITPTVNTSKVLVLLTQGYQLYLATSGGEMQGDFQILRGATGIMSDSAVAIRASGYSSELNDRGNFAYTYLDSPATTSATTYKTQFKNSAALGIFRVNNNVSSITLIEIGA